MKNDKSSIASQFGGIPMKALIGAPLKAAADANAMLGKSQMQFVLSSCFEKDEEGNLQAKMVSFSVERSVIRPDGEVLPNPAKFSLSVPILTLLPMNTLGVDEVDISFDMVVKSSVDHNHETGEDIKKSSKGDITEHSNSEKFHSEMYGVLSSSEKESSQSTSSAHYQIKLSASDKQLPKGLSAILDSLIKNISPIQLKKD